MKKATKLAAAAVAMALAGGPVHAAVYDFTLTDSAGDTVVGQPDTVGDTVTAISGTLDGFTITGLSTYAGADQTLYPTTPYVDFSGISFTANGVSYNWSNYSGSDSTLGGIANSVSDSGGYGCCQAAITSVTVTAVPELSTWAMMLAGFAGLGFAGYRRTKSDRAALAS